MQLSQEQLQVKNKALRWQGDNHVSFEKGSLQELESQGELTLTQSSAQQPQLELLSESIQWNGNINVKLVKNQLQKLFNSGDFSVAQLTLNHTPDQQSQLQLGTSEITWKGSNDLLFAESALEEITNKGSLSVNQLELNQDAAQKMDLSSTNIHWNGSNNVKFADNQLEELLNKGEFSVAKLKLEQPDLSVSEDHIRWNGDLKSDFRESLSLNGSFSTQPSEISLGHLKVSSHSRKWDGSASIILKPFELSELSGSADIEQLSVTQPSGTTLATIQKIQLLDLAALPNNTVQASKLDIEAIKLTNNKPLLDLSAVEISPLQVGATEAVFGTVNIAELITELNLSGKGTPQAWLDWQSAITGTTSNEPVEEEAAASTEKQSSEKDSSPFHFAIKTVQLEAPAQIKFSDESVNARDIDIQIQKLQLTNIDSASSAPGPFLLAAKINRFGELKAAGNYSWMSPLPNGDWKGSLNNLELPPFSPYMQKYSGYQLRSGQFTIKTGGKISEGKINSQNKINIRNLDVKQKKDSSAKEFNQQLGMPLETAISILTDDDNNVELEVPINGSVNDPEFGYQSVINIVMTKVAKEGAIGYLSNALQPYGALISLGRMVVNSASKNAINLEPVSFAPGSPALDTKATDYLSKISSLLKEREALRLNLCGIAVASDTDAIKQQFLINQKGELTTPPSVTTNGEKPKALPDSSQKPQAKASTATASIKQIGPDELAAALNTLAEDRSENVKAYLIEEAKIEADRLFSCLPQVMSDSEQPPQVSLGF